MLPRPTMILGIAAGIGAAAVLLGLTVSLLHHKAPPERLSVFEPHAGGCGWYSIDLATLEEQPIVHFQNDCPTVQVAWAPGGREAVVWFTPQGYPSREDMAYLVNVGAQTLRRLPLPDAGETLRFAVDDKRRVLAFTEDQQVDVASGPAPYVSDELRDDAAEAADDAADAAVEAAEAAGAAGDLTVPPPDAAAPLLPLQPEARAAWLEYAGRRYPASTFPDGDDTLVHTLVLDGSTWRVLETQASRCCADGAPGIQALTTYARMARDPRYTARASQTLLTTAPYLRPVGAGHRFDDSRALLPAGVDAASAAWGVLENKLWPRALLVRTTATQPARATGVAFFEEPDQLRAPPGFSFQPNDVLQLPPRGARVLVTDGATGSDPHLYDMLTGHLVYSSSVAACATFWPEADATRAR